MHKIAQVMVCKGRTLWLDIGNTAAKHNDHCLIEADGNKYYAKVVSGLQEVADCICSKDRGQIIRVATESDISQIQDISEREKKSLAICVEKAAKHDLPIRVIDAKFAYDRSRIIFHFVADNRVDFRELLKDIERTLKTRVELRQIGVRDRAKIAAGYGHCGRVLCCASFIKEFQTVTIQNAKSQNFHVDPSKISGLCGRLMCCLRYESETYQEMRESFPEIGTTINTEHGQGKVVDLNILRGSITVELEDGKRTEVFANRVGKF